MKVDKIYQSYNNNGHCNHSNTASKNIVFSKKPPLDLDNKIMNELPNKKSIKFMKNLEWLKGEIGGILITAIGTGLVAPFPIAYNPFVKAPKGATEEEIEDVKNTKKYSAMRQPISAVLAILFQVSALKPIDKLLDAMFNNPKYAKHFGVNVDQSAINGSSYIAKLAKQKIKSENPLLKGKKYDELLEITKKEIEDSQITEVANKFKETGKIMIGDRSLANKDVAELINSQIDDYIKDADKLKIDYNGLAYYSDRAEILMNNKERLTEICKNAPRDNAKVTEYIKNLLAKETNPDIKVLLEEVLDKPVEIQHRRLARTYSRIKQIENMCEGSYSHDKYLNAMTLRNSKMEKIITELKRTKIKKLNEATDSVIKETINKVVGLCTFDNSDSLMRTILHDTNTFDPNKEDIANKVNKDVAKKYKNFVRNHYKGLNQIIKIAIGVCITLPITCNVLNWVYPRIMDKWFPELAGSKKAQKAREVK